MNARPFWVLASDNPAELVQFYAALVTKEAFSRGSTWVLQLEAAGDLVFYCPSKNRPQPAQPGRLALCLQVLQLEAAISKALALGGQCLEPARQESFGREAWLSDPEGNRLLLLEPQLEQLKKL
jgi:predicted enzyme related to lactoylglutathione lyase